MSINIRPNKEKRLWRKLGVKFGLFFMLVMLASCKSKQIVAEKSVVDKTTVEDVATKKEDLQEKRETETNITGTSEIDIAGVIYDTSKPPNPATGKPPILFEGTITRHENGDITKKETYESSATVDETETIKKQNNVQEDTAIKEETNNRIPAFYHWCAAIVITLVVFSLIYIVRKRFL